ncbi:MAG: sulfur oxidation c-type cytochrome SoxA [Gammaproteobacteria bacterium]|nr:sulfur oxidation c-type cytochrome SoxA [Gammaproteobacteria bacterium]MBI5616855.1 sulfur oxidation c-type cytochrome SoxA [Gammaproteobacteria bacterium]
MRSTRRSSALVCCGLLACALIAAADPAADRAAFRAAYAERFPQLAPADYVLGAYAIDAGLKRQWEDLNEFPPYEFAIDEGRAAFAAPLPDGATLEACFPNAGAGAAARFPRIDADGGEVTTLSRAVNACRIAHGARELAVEGAPMKALLAYLGFVARDQPLAIADPATPAALRHYEAGRALFYTKRGQRNFSCADCHVTAVGHHLREQPLMPLLGVGNHYPVYGLSWGGMGTLHARFEGCYEQTGAEAPAAQSEELSDLEYFLAVMANGLPIVAPGLHR